MVGNRPLFLFVILVEHLGHGIFSSGCSNYVLSPNQLLGGTGLKLPNRGVVLEKKSGAGTSVVARVLLDTLVRTFRGGILLIILLYHSLALVNFTFFCFFSSKPPEDNRNKNVTKSGTRGGYAWQQWRSLLW